MLMAGRLNGQATFRRIFPICSNAMHGANATDATNDEAATPRMAGHSSPDQAARAGQFGVPV